jgi:cytochrome c biogenesis protein CcmG/thiol:disulfide interchange protein DsbE
MPAMTLPAIVPDRPGTGAHVAGPRLVNIFASWCVPCAAEAGELSKLQQRGVAIDGIAVRDTPQDVAAFLTRYGNPYRTIGSDPQSRSMMALGSSGVPESFLVDSRGVIRHQHIGPVGPQDVEEITRLFKTLQ